MCSVGAAYVERAHAQVRRALSHLEALRSLQGRAEPEARPIALDRMIQALACDLRSLAEAEDVRVHAERKVRVVARADPAYLRTILENLLDNSLHSPSAARGGTVTILLTREAERAVIRVCDDGPALEPSMHATLFDPLRTTKHEGLGLGLPIARALARALRGELSLERGKEKAFRLELPIEKHV